MQRHFLLVLLFLLFAWLLGPSSGALAPRSWADFWALRGALILGTGYLAIGCMSVAMILAARPARLEGGLGGLDRFYRLHKRLGIAGALFGLAHWLLEIVPRWMVGRGWLERPQRRDGGAAAPELLRPWRELAGELGEWGLYLVLALVAVALWRRIPYRHFARLHRLLPIAYGLLVFHSVVFMPASYWTSPPGPVLVPLMLGGLVAAALSLSGRIGFTRRALGHVESLRLHDDQVLEVHCQLETPWAGHESGQFVFATFDRREGAHPFSVASAWCGDGHLVLAIKGLGDYTRRLPELLQLGAPVTIEGPYGRFNFEGRGARQVWVAGGIGITPFISRMQQLARGEAPRQPVALFYSTDAEDAALFTLLRELAQQGGVSLHVVVPPREGRLPIERIVHSVPEPAQAEVWFCGPRGFGEAVRKAFLQQGLPAGQFHQEVFEMR